MNYTYDGDGNRLQKSNGKIYWYGAGTQILDESGASGTITDEYVYFGGKRIAHRVVSGNTISYYAEDFLGSSRAMTTSTGTLCYDADFYPFGGERIVTNTCAQNYKFEGKERDTETNNDDFGARYYSSQFGRWTSPDWSAVPVPVPYANLTNPQTLNLYAMVRDNPETFADLDGHCCDWSSGWDGVKDEVSFFGQELLGAGKMAVNLVPDTYNTLATVVNAETAGTSMPQNLPLAPTLPLTSVGQVVGADIATLGLAATGLAGDAPAAGVQTNRAAGLDFEGKALESEGLSKNTAPMHAVDPKTGQTGTTIPDAVRSNGQTVEMKNVKNLGDSPQLRRQSEISGRSGQKGQVIVSSRNQKISPSVKQRMDIKKIE